MRKFAMLGLAMLLTVSYLAAQTKPAAGGNMVNVMWKCGKPNPVNMIPVPGSTTHAFGVQQVACTATTGEIGGVKEKEGTAVEVLEANGDSSKGHGAFVETLTNGDKINYTYTFTGTGKNNMMVSGNNAWQITGGTGKFKGITGKGTCTGKGNPDGSADFTCTGTYAMK